MPDRRLIRRRTATIWRWRGEGSSGSGTGRNRPGRLDSDPFPAVGAEQMQLVAGRNGPDSLADGGADGAGNPDDHLAGRQVAGVGGNALGDVLPRAVDEGFGADFLNRFDGEAERDAA